MSKTIIIAIVAVVLVVGGGAALIALNSNNNDESNESSQTSNTATETNQQTASFNAVSTAGTSFIATMNGTTADSGNYSATIENDGQGNAHFYGDYGSDSFEIYALTNRYIICNQGQCIESPIGSGGSPISDDQYEYTEEDLSNYRENAVYKGVRDCSTGTCDVWELDENGYTGTLYVDASGRINRAEWSGEEGSFSIDYEYKDVTITPPDNVLTTPTT